MTGTPARRLLRPHRFAHGEPCGFAELSSRLPSAERRALVRGLAALPAGLSARLPPIKIAAAPRLFTPVGHDAHAASFISERYLLLAGSLFARPGELRRILYHELCHFLWPRLGNGRRRLYEVHLAREFAARVDGELGYSSASAKEALTNRLGDRTAEELLRDRPRAWRHYVCESFCDTGAFVLLLGGRRRAHHAEWTLQRRARAWRLRAWAEAAGVRPGV